MVEKIIVTPTSVRGMGNIISPKTDDDFTVDSQCTLDESTDTVNGVSVNVYTLSPPVIYSLTFSQSTYTVPLGSSATVSVTLTGNGSAVNGATITFSWTDGGMGPQTDTSTTNSSGVATKTFTAQQISSIENNIVTATYETTTATCRIVLSIDPIIDDY